MKNQKNQKNQQNLGFEEITETENYNDDAQTPVKQPEL